MRALRLWSAARALLVAFGLAPTLTACSAPGDWDATRARAAPILDGQLAQDETSVVGVVDFAGGQCSGSLIAPNLVLTARHCIASSADDTTEVRCDQTKLEAPDSAGAVFVVPLPRISDDPADYRSVRAIHTPPGAAQLCGSDVAVLELRAAISFPTLTPRLAPPLAPGESYTAVGYGVDGTQARGASGVRRSLSGLVVDCVGSGCDAADVYDNEWLGPGGACSGDSGGPALDADRRVSGVLSRGKMGCLGPVYADVSRYAEWLRATALTAAEAGPYDAPAWACPACRPKAERSRDSSCALGAHSSSAPRWLTLLFAVAPLVARALSRRRRRSLGRSEIR